MAARHQITIQCRDREDRKRAVGCKAVVALQEAMDCNTKEEMVEVMEEGAEVI